MSPSLSISYPVSNAKIIQCCNILYSFNCHAVASYQNLINILGHIKIAKYCIKNPRSSKDNIIMKAVQLMLRPMIHNSDTTTLANTAASTQITNPIGVPNNY